MKPPITESRLDFSGGLNVSAPVDSLNTNELRETTNCRVEPHGGLIRRLGSKKLNATAMTAANGATAITGVYQWQGSDGRQEIVALNRESLWHAHSPYETFVAKATTADLNSNFWPGDFTLFRDSSSGVGSVEQLYFTHCGMIHRWDGGNYAQVTGTNSAPSASSVRAFGNRIFANTVFTNPKSQLNWSKLGNGSDFTIGGISDGGFALVGTDDLVALETIGSSLLLGTPNNVSRFTGIGADIQILTDTFGVSADVGPLALGAFLRADQFGVFVSDRGPYVVTEGGTIFIGEKILTSSPSVITMLPDLTPLIGHNRRRKEVWFAYVPLDSGEPVSRTSVLIYNYHMQCWYGRFQYPFSITSLGRYQDSQGVEGIMAGCSDGFIRILDDVSAGSLDDDGRDYNATVQFAPFGLESGPYNLKALEHVFLQTIGAAQHTVSIIGDLGDSEVATLVQ